MKFDRDFLTSGTGQVMLVGAVLLLGVLAVRWQNQRRPAPALPAAKPAPSPALPKTLTRDGVRFIKPPAPPGNPVTLSPASATGRVVKTDAPRELPLTLVSASREIPAPAKTKTESIPFNKDDFKNDPLIQKALEIFKGQIVDVRS